MSEKKVKVGVGVLILREDKILLGKRASDYSNNMNKISNSGGSWTCPGGGIDFGETLSECAIRELKEETNLEAMSVEFLSVSDDLSGQAQYVTVNFIATEFTGELNNNEPNKIDEWRWFPVDELPENLFGPSSNTIESYLSKKQYI